MEKVSTIPLISLNLTWFILFLSEELTIRETSSKKASWKPLLITSFLSKFISNGLDISISSILKDFPKTLVVEKKKYN